MITNVFQNYTANVIVDKKLTILDLCDTKGGEENKKYRRNCYAKVDIFLLCFSILDPISFLNLKTNWLEELKPYSNNSKFNFVRTKRRFEK